MPTTTARLASTGRMLALAAFAAFVLPAQAQAGNEKRAACTSDVFRLCNNEAPRVDHMISCLKKEQSNLSPGCRATVGDKK